MSKVRTSLRRTVREARIRREWVRAPDLDEFRRWQDAAEDNVRLVTLSPEWPEATRYIEHAHQRGSASSASATPEPRASRFRTRCSAGATLSTHLGNGAHATLPRHPNYIWEQLAEDRLAASFIVDGLHLPESFLRVALRAKGIGRSILVTDAVAPAMCAAGAVPFGRSRYRAARRWARDDARRRAAGRIGLADGSCDRQRDADGGRFAWPRPWTMATRNPARVGRVGEDACGV